MLSFGLASFFACAPTHLCLVPLTLCASNFSSVTPDISTLSLVLYTRYSQFSLSPSPSLNFCCTSFELSATLTATWHTILPLPDTLPSDPLQSQYDSWLSLVDHLNIKAFVNLTLANSVRHGIQHLLFISGLGKCLRHHHKMCLFANSYFGKCLTVSNYSFVLCAV